MLEQQVENWEAAYDIHKNDLLIVLSFNPSKPTKMLDAPTRW
jgi:hypothetical protein